MFLEGKVKKYNEERGFGFIDVEGKHQDLFFHIKDMPNKNIPPQIGERLKFRVVDDQGKLKADQIVRLDVVIEQAEPKKSPQRLHRNRQRHNRQERRGLGGYAILLVVMVVVGTLGYMLYEKYERAQLAQQSPILMTETAAVMSDTPAVNSHPSAYQCDGRIHCSQMTSREEARWFVRNCPGTKMDGNNDGEPCENDTRW